MQLHYQNLYMQMISMKNVSDPLGILFREYPIRMSLTVDGFVHSLICKYIQWNRTLGADHFVVICHDIGLVVTAQALKNVIRIVGSPTYACEYVPHKDVSPPLILMPMAYEKH